MCWGEGRAVWRPPCTAFRNYHGMFKSRSLNSERNHMLRFSGGFIQGILRAWDLCPLIQSTGTSKNNVRLFFECAAFLFWSPPPDADRCFQSQAYVHTTTKKTWLHDLPPSICLRLVRLPYQFLSLFRSCTTNLHSDWVNSKCFLCLIKALIGYDSLLTYINVIKETCLFILKTPQNLDCNC